MMTRKHTITRLSVIPCLVLVALAIASSLGLATQAQAVMVGQWTFEPGQDLIDTQGNFPTVVLHGDASIIGGQLDVNGAGTLASGWAAAQDGAGYTGPNITNKTLVSWLTLEGLEDVAKAGSALTIDTVAGDVFDGIVFAEASTNRWMNGSNGFSRTDPSQFNGDPSAVETSTGNPIQMAITYQDQGGGNVEITAYRNGVLIGQYTDSPLATWVAGNTEIIWGKRHGDPNDPNPGALDALIEESRVYNTALTLQEIVALQPFKANSIPEPSSYALGLLALAGFATLAWRRRPRA